MTFDKKNSVKFKSPKGKKERTGAEHTEEN